MASDIFHLHEIRIEAATLILMLFVKLQDIKEKWFSAETKTMKSISITVEKMRSIRIQFFVGAILRLAAHYTCSLVRERVPSSKNSKLPNANLLNVNLFCA